MVVEGVAAEGEEDQVPPASVGERLGLEDDQDEEAYVLDAPCLLVELHHVEVGRIMPDDRSRSRGRGPDVRRGWKAEELLGVGNLAGQGVSLVTLALPSESGLTHAGPALRSRSTSSGESGDEGGVRTMHHGRRRRCREGGRAHSCTWAGSKPPGQGAPGCEERPGHAKAYSNGGSSSPGVGCCGRVVVRAQVEHRGVRDVLRGICRRRALPSRRTRCSRAGLCVRARCSRRTRRGVRSSRRLRARDGRQEQRRAVRGRQGRSGLATRGGGGGLGPSRVG